jgi:Mn2+/Fe2+ NRAMP family transporter
LDNFECIGDKTNHSVYKTHSPLALPKRNTALIGAAFLMATSAVGPGFLTQTTFFTQELAASFGFVILLSVLLDIGAQLNIWRTVVVAGKNAQEVANAVIPWSGVALSILVVMGGLAFNIGNIGGAGLGLDALFGVNVKLGAALSAVVASFIFIQKDAGKVLDYFTRFMALTILLLIGYTVFTVQPPLAEAISGTFWPTAFDAKATVTLVGGTVGGYITFAGAHRLIDGGIKGESALPIVNKSAANGILITACIRYLLFLATFGVIAAGGMLDVDNPPASVFRLATGEVGEKLFGIVMWSAAVTSVVGAAYTSFTFLKGVHPKVDEWRKVLIISFIWISTIVFLFVGKPVKTLIFVGMLNGFILPIGLSLMLLAARKKSLVGTYRTPLFLEIMGWGIVVMMAVLSVLSIL